MIQLPRAHQAHWTQPAGEVTPRIHEALPGNAVVESEFMQRLIEYSMQQTFQIVADIFRQTDNYYFISISPSSICILKSSSAASAARSIDPNIVFPSSAAQTKIFAGIQEGRQKEDSIKSDYFNDRLNSAKQLLREAQQRQYMQIYDEASARVQKTLKQAQPIVQPSSNATETSLHASHICSSHPQNDPQKSKNKLKSTCNRVRNSSSTSRRLLKYGKDKQNNAIQTKSNENFFKQCLSTGMSAMPNQGPK